MTSKKISNFTQQVSFQTTDSLNIVRSGVNYRVPFSAVVTALGATGTLASVGPGVPVLEQPTSLINKIRTISSGAGILASITANNDISIKQNITVDATGVPIIVDKFKPAPVYRSLVSGAGATVTQVGNTIEVSATGVQEANKVIVNTIDDFPAASGGVITLVDDKHYVISAPITTANRFVCGVDNIITMGSLLSPTLTYTGSGDMFTAVDKRVNFVGCNFTCASGTFLNASGTVPGGLVFISDVLINECSVIAVLSNLTFVNIMTFSCNESVTGITVSGSNYVIFGVDRMALFSTSVTFIGLDLGTSVHSRLDIEGVFAAPAGAIGIKGAAASVNLLSGQLGKVSRCNFSPNITPISGIATTDIRWDFFENNRIKDTMNDALISFNGSSTETVISTVNTPVIVNATWVVIAESKFTCTTGGRCTYDGERDENFPIDISIGIISAGGGGIDVSVYLAKNGAVVTASKVTLAISGTSAAIVSIPWQDTLEEADFLEVFVENNTGTTNIIVEHAKLRVK